MVIFQKHCLNVVILRLLLETYQVLADGGGISGPPEIIEHPLDTVVPKGEPVTLNCKASGNPTPQVIWYKDGELLSTAAEESSSHRVLLPAGSLFFLRVHQGKPKPDSGVYWCMARNVHGIAQSRNATLRIATLRDDFRTRPKNVQAVLGQQATLECSPPRGYPEPVVSWKKDGRDLRLDQDMRRTVHQTGDLIITDVQPVDAGFYTCLARNMVGTRETEAVKLTVYEKPKFSKEPQDTTIEVGGDVDFACRISGDPPPVITWRKKDGRMPPGRAQVSGSDLRIDRVMPTDEGEYVCNGRNPAGVVEASARLIVHSPPSFSAKPQDQVAEEGSMVAFKCEAIGTPTPAKFWSKEGLQDLMFPGHWSIDNRLEVTNEGHLKINNVQMSDEGQFVCSALNAAGSNSAKASLKVTGGTLLQHPPPIILKGPLNQTLPLTSLAILPCSANGRQAPTITWLKNNTELPPNDSRFSVSSSGALHINELRKEDSALYTCRALNDDGEDRWSASLIVEDHMTPNVVFQRMPEPSTFPSAPGRPHLLNVSDTSATLEWDPPTRPGASQVVQYRVSYFTPQDGARWNAASDQPVRASAKYAARNLKPATAYIFVVRAENQHGISDPSPMSVVVRTRNPTPAALDANSELAVAKKRLSNESLCKLREVRTINSTAVQLTWKVLRSDVPLSGFNIRWRMQLQHTASSSSAEIAGVYGWLNVTSRDARTALIGGLKPFTNYEFFVRPYFKSVEGMPSNILDATTEEAPPSLPPTDVQVRMMNLTTLRISWRPPPLDGINGVLKGYHIVVLGNETRFHRNVTTAERAASVTLFHLVPDITYHVQVAAYTSAGIGKFYDRDRVTMNNLTLKRHIALDRSETGHGATFLEVFKSPWFIVVLCVILWLVIAIVIGTIYWFRCQLGKNMKTTRHDLPFIKINDGSVSTGAGAREALWLDHQFYGASGLVAQPGHPFNTANGYTPRCYRAPSRDDLGFASGAAIAGTMPMSFGAVPTALCGEYGRSNDDPYGCQAPYYHSVGGSEYHQVNPPSPTPYATTTLVMNAHRQRLLAQQHQQQQHYAVGPGYPNNSFFTSSGNNINNGMMDSRKLRQPVLLDFIPPPPAQPPPPDPCDAALEENRRNQAYEQEEGGNLLRQCHSQKMVIANAVGNGGTARCRTSNCGIATNTKQQRHQQHGFAMNNRRSRKRIDASHASDYNAGGESSSSNASSPDRLLARKLNPNLYDMRSSALRSPTPSECISQQAQVDIGSPRSSFLGTGAAGCIQLGSDSKRSSMMASLATSDNDGEDEAESRIDDDDDDFDPNENHPHCNNGGGRMSDDCDDLARHNNLESLGGAFLQSAEFTQALANKGLVATATNGHTPPYRSNQPSMGIPASAMLNSQYGLKPSSNSTTRMTSLPRPVNGQKRSQIAGLGPRDVV